MRSRFIETKRMREKVLLVIVDFHQKRATWGVKDILEEMRELVVACAGEVVDSLICRVDKPSAGLLISEGKAQEIVNLCAVKDVNTVIFSQDLKGSQQRNLEEIIKKKTIDRTQLILDIFARRATSQEGKMQVELAQLEYLLPRLVGQGIELSRLGGGIGTLGPGETKLEVDRRRIGQKITRLKKDLKDVALNRALKRKKRKEQGIPAVSLVGYTNAGKSTLLNSLTEAEQITKDGLFTTLDSLSRQLILPNRQKVILSDTVGFMHELPHHLIEAFKATLEEVKQADLLLHVVDVSHPQVRNYYEAVVDVLKELGVTQTPTIVVLNKIDRLEDKSWLKDLEANFEHAVSISAKTGENIEKLKEKILTMSSRHIVEIDTDIPLDRMDLVNLAHREGHVLSIQYLSDHIHLRASLPAHLAGKFTVK